MVGCKSESLGSIEVYSSRIDVLGNGMDQTGPLDLVLYPNPNDGSFTFVVTVPEPGKYTMQLFSNLGVLVYEIKDVRIEGKFRKTIHVDFVADGVYNFILTNNKDQVVQKRIIIKKN
jgi:hypothetical protein